MMKTLITFCSIIVFFTSSGICKEQLIFGGIENSVNHRIGAAILKNAYASIGYEISFMVLPTKRSLQHANDGSVSGEVQRVDGINKDYTNLVKVPTPLFLHIGSIYTRNLDFQVKGWESLTPYSIGIRRGVKFAERGTANHPKRILVGSFEQLIQILQKGRVDAIVGSKYYYDDYIKRKGIKDVRRLDPPIHEKPLYHYLHKRHNDLVPLIDKALGEMIKSGDADKIRLQILNFISLEPR